jgi:uncharacterized membrane protein
MRVLYELSVLIHILAVCAWMGGTIFLIAVVLPVVRQPDTAPKAPLLIHRTGVLFRRLAWISFATLALTGVLSLVFRGLSAQLLVPRFWSTGFGQILATKLALVAVIVGLAVYHDFAVGPKATRVWRQDPTSPQAKALRRQATWIGRLNMLLGLVVMALAVALVRGWPF